jgi:hypothetical protein
MWIKGVKRSIKTCVQKGKFYQNGMCIYIWVHCLRPGGIIFSLIDWVLVEGVTQDSSDTRQDHF